MRKERGIHPYGRVESIKKLRKTTKCTKLLLWTHGTKLSTNRINGVECFMVDFLKMSKNILAFCIKRQTRIYVCEKFFFIEKWQNGTSRGKNSEIEWAKTTTEMKSHKSFSYPRACVCVCNFCKQRHFTTSQLPTFLHQTHDTSVPQS